MRVEDGRKLAGIVIGRQETYAPVTVWPVIEEGVGLYRVGQPYRVTDENTSDSADMNRDSDPNIRRI